MKFIFLFAIICLCNISSKGSERKIELTDLPYDVLFDIFDHFDFNHFITLTEAIPNLSPVIQGYARIKYKDFPLQIRPSNADWKDNVINMEEKCFEIYQLTLATEIIENFGGNLRKIEILSRLSSSESTQLNQIINEHCSKTLTHFSLGIIESNTLQDFAVPFESVEAVTFRITHRIGYGLVSLNQFFPQLKHITIEILGEVGSKFIDYNIPKLEKLTIKSDHYSIGSAPGRCSEQITKFLEENQQIRSVNLEYSTEYYINHINQSLPNIEDLEMECFEPRNHLFHFEHVKNLIYHCHDFSKLTNFTFPRLESLQIGTIPNEWVDFFARHDFLSKLECTMSSADDLIPFTTNFRNLVEIKVRVYSYNDIEDIAKFIQFREKLMKIEFELFNVSESDKNTLREQCASQWSISEFDGLNLSFTSLLLERNV